MLLLAALSLETASALRQMARSTACKSQECDSITFATIVNSQSLHSVLKHQFASL